LCGQSAQESARELARRIASAGATGAAVRVQNPAGLPAELMAQIRTVFEQELHSRAGAQTEVLVTISENVTSTVLAAEWRHRDERSVFLGIAPRIEFGGPAQANALVTISATRVFEQDTPILDFALLPQERLLVLDTAAVTLYVRKEARWQLLKAATVNAPRPWPRDPRGKLQLTGDAFKAFLPGVTCLGVLDPELPLNCVAPDEPWPLLHGLSAPLAAGRNYFVAATPLFAMAAPDVYSTTDGRVRAGLRYADNLGSDVAGIETRCGRVVLGTRPGNGPDAVQPFLFSKGALTAAGTASDLPGPVTALWTSGPAANAVVREFQTGRYAAYTLALACGG
jgi:hypothetical protein